MADKELFELTLTGTPPVTRRIAFGDPDVLALNMTFEQLFVYLKTNISYNDQFLNKTNTTLFNPTADYHPATMKYVDDNLPATVQGYTTLPPSAGMVEEDETIVRAAQWGPIICITGRVTLSGASSDDVIFNLPMTFSTATVRIDFSSNDGNNDESNEFYIPANTREIRVGSGFSSAQQEAFVATYLAI